MAGLMCFIAFAFCIVFFTAVTIRCPGLFTHPPAAFKDHRHRRIGALAPSAALGAADISALAHLPEKLKSHATFLACIFIDRHKFSLIMVIIYYSAFAGFGANPIQNATISRLSLKTHAPALSITLVDKTSV
jgi:hypothetical protein